MEHDDMCDKILRSLIKTIDSNPEIDDFNIIPTVDNSQNRNPVRLEEGHLGVESWCVKYVYEYACSKLLKSRRPLENDQIYLVRGAILIHPDVCTFWNMLREMKEFQFDYEFYFSKLVLTRKTKCHEAFAYRRWLIQRILLGDTTNLSQILENEFQVCQITALTTPHNYHSWTHRRWCLSHHINVVPQKIFQELNFTLDLLSTHVSEYSIYFYRQVLFDILYSNPNLFDYVSIEAYREIETKLHTMSVVDYLLGPSTNSTKILPLLLTDLLIKIPQLEEYLEGHEAVWYHRRYLLLKIIRVAYDYFEEHFELSQSIRIDNDFTDRHLNIIESICENAELSNRRTKIQKTEISKFSASKLHDILKNAEKSYVEKCFRSTTSANQTRLARRHVKWLKYIVNIDWNIDE